VETVFIETLAISPNYHSDRTVIIHVQGKGLFKTTNGGETFDRLLITYTNNHPLAIMYSFPSQAYQSNFHHHIQSTRRFMAHQQNNFFSPQIVDTWRIITVP
jgi:hypothetical protein